MMYIFLIIIFVVLFAYFRDNNDDSKKVRHQGGIKTKYSFLIEEILLSSHTHSITEITNRTCVIGGYYGDYGLIYCSYHLDYAFNRLRIVWKFESSYYGNYTETLTFNENYNQELILEELSLKIENITKQIVKNL